MKKIGTHDGTFHCDEALACYMLRLTETYKNAEIIRTRDESILKTLSILVDVGSVYDPSTCRFDHHQRGFNETLSPRHKTKLSSAGLIYKHFGLEIIENITKLSANDIKIVYDKVYESFIEAIDGIDNGIPQYPPDITPNYSVQTDLSSRVGHLNPAWNEKKS